MNGNPNITWLGQVDDPCASIQGQINNLNEARAQIVLDANTAALQAAQAGAPQSTIDQIVSQKNSAVATIDGQLGQLKQLLANCKALTPGCNDTTPCPAGQVCVGGKCVTPGPAPTPTPTCSATTPCPQGFNCVAGECVPAATQTTTKKSSGVGLLILGSVAAAGALFLGPALLGKKERAGLARADAQRAARLQSNPFYPAYKANRSRRRYAA